MHRKLCMLNIYNKTATFNLRNVATIIHSHVANEECHEITFDNEKYFILYRDRLIQMNLNENIYSSVTVPVALVTFIIRTKRS